MLLDEMPDNDASPGSSTTFDSTATLVNFVNVSLGSEASLPLPGTVAFCGFYV